MVRRTRRRTERIILAQLSQCCSVWFITLLIYSSLAWLTGISSQCELHSTTKLSPLQPAQPSPVSPRVFRTGPTEVPPVPGGRAGGGRG